MPQRTSVLPVVNRSLLYNWLAHFGAGPTIPTVTTVTVRLFKAGPTPITPDTQLADFTECDFGGYAGVVVTAFPRVTLPSNNGCGIAINALFTSDGTPPADNLVQGYYIEDTAGSSVVIAEYFPAPIPIAFLGDFVDLLALIPDAYTVQCQ